MNMTIQLLEKQKHTYRTKITNCNNKISKAEKAYESLRQFRPIVERSQGGFSSINSGKMTVLADVKAVKNCRTATKYYEGMKLVLSGIGSKIVGIAYGTLLFSIRNKLQAYRNTINNSDDDIRSYRRSIEKIDALIKAEKEAEELKAKSGGIL